MSRIYYGKEEGRVRDAVFFENIAQWLCLFINNHLHIIIKLYFYNRKIMYWHNQYLRSMKLIVCIVLRFLINIISRHVDKAFFSAVALHFKAT